MKRRTRRNFTPATRKAACERDDDVAAHASGMDEFSAPEGGQQR